MKKLLLLALVLLLLQPHLNAQTDSLKGVVAGNYPDTAKYNALFELSRIYLDSGIVGVNYLQAAADLATNMDDANRTGKAYHTLGFAFFRKGDFQRAIEYYNKALSQLDKNQHAKEYAGVNNDLGLAYKSMGKYDVALSHYIVSLNEYTTIKDLKGIGLAYNNIGQVYYYQNDYKKAIEYFTKYEDVARKLGNPMALAGAENNIGGAYSEIGNLHQALYHYQYARHLYDSLGSRFGVAVLDDNIGSISYKLGDYRMALVKHLSCYRTFKALGMRERMIFSQHNLGLAYMGQGKLDMAKRSMKEALSIAEEIGQSEACKLLYESLAQVYQRANNYPEALKAYKSFTALKDSLNGAETQKQIAEIQAKYESEKKEKELLKQQVQLRNQKRMLIFGGVTLLGFAVLSLMLVNENRIKKRAFMALASEQRKITESITYASKIQSAVLPPTDIIRQYFPDHFIFFRPRDIVSGDFYWFSVNKNRIYFAAVDCTGHGVPGAFMSMLGFTMLNQIVSSGPNLTASEILDQLREDVKQALHQKGSMNEPHDGMDIAFCVLNIDDLTLQFSGAHNPLYLIRDGELVQYAGDLMPIGHAGILESKSFTNHVIQLSKGDLIYLFSDGFTDQFGGEDGQKFKRTLFRKTLLAMHHEPMDVQERLLGETLEMWKLDYEQVDDILVFGVRF